MLLSPADTATDPIAPATRRMAGLLAREKTGEILAHLHRRPYLAASEIARLEDIHVATAQRYLKELVEAGLLGCRLRANAPRPTEEYWLVRPQITIQIDLDGAAPATGPALVEAAQRIVVRDRMPPNIIYDTDPRTGQVEGLLVLSARHPRQVEERIRVSQPLGRFLAQLATAGDAPRSIWDTMQRAGLGEEHLPEVLGNLGRFIGEPATTGSARPLDPDTRRLFAEFSASAGPLVARPTTVPLLELAEVTPPRPRDRHRREERA